MLLLLFWIKFLNGDNDQTVYFVLFKDPLSHYIKNILFFVTVS